MDTVKRNYATVNNWIKTMKSLCVINITFKIAVYNTLSFERGECCFEVVAKLKDIVDHFGEYFIYCVTTDKYGEENIPCLKLLVCKNRPDEKCWIENMKTK